VGAAIVASVDAPPILEPAEHVLDTMTLAIEGSVVRDLDFAVGFEWDARRDPACCQGLAEPVGIVTSIAQQGFGLGERVNHERRALVEDVEAAPADGPVLYSSCVVSTAAEEPAIARARSRKQVETSTSETLASRASGVGLFVARLTPVPDQATRAATSALSSLVPETTIGMPAASAIATVP
jgi:hypothetical protein